ncbi:isocitrate lyase/phosphoenolpyruvate mutase family protein [Microbacterium elymi]|uniref:Isocitrate lyase/phosphoenolpyruvate mutase family protein n=1 Tax=Microbacterium elymi TaxID=2909587 RepID=A0ABY5NGL6_9MICO|nr:isocitrate lyase/phosphoenolpyruvate mutase family protein [Microbacterium elymi]UUT34291.1 isocitrate lyase/phosphoenolpyruvate mutase family protein [Microbacterium elymi]
MGHSDGELSRDIVLAHCAALVDAVDIPISADLEGGFGDGLDEVAETYARAARIGLAGASIEDSVPDDAAPIRDSAAAPNGCVSRPRPRTPSTPRSWSPGGPRTSCTGGRTCPTRSPGLQAYQDAGADVLYAPGLMRADDIRAVVTSVDRPVNVLLRRGGPGVAELRALGVARISVGGRFAFAAFAAADAAARAFLDEGREPGTA